MNTSFVCKIGISGVNIPQSTYKVKGSSNRMKIYAPYLHPGRNHDIL